MEEGRRRAPKMLPQRVYDAHGAAGSIPRTLPTIGMGVGPGGRGWARGSLRLRDQRARRP